MAGQTARSSLVKSVFDQKYKPAAGKKIRDVLGYEWFLQTGFLAQSPGRPPSCLNGYNKIGIEKRFSGIWQGQDRELKSAS
jgi:hypothetical protein